MVKSVSKGRRKIEMKKIQKKSNLGVTFTKRRSGIFKKANELVALCGAEVAVVIFSPGNKPYSYGHPNVFTILDRAIGDFTRFNDVPNSDNADENKKDNINVLFELYNDVQREVDVEKMNVKKNKQVCTIEMPPSNQLSYGQSLQLRSGVLDLKMIVLSELEKRNLVDSSKATDFIGGGEGLNNPDYNYLGAHGETPMTDVYGSVKYNDHGAPSGNHNVSIDPNINCGPIWFDSLGAPNMSNIQADPENYGSVEFNELGAPNNYGGNPMNNAPAETNNSPSSYNYETWMF